MRSKVICTALALCGLAVAAQAQTVSGEEIQDAVAGVPAGATVAEAPSKQVIDAVKDAPPAIVSGSLTVTPTIDVPGAVSASIPAAVSASAGVTTLDEAFAAISDTTITVEPETTTLEGSGEKLEDYMKDAARPQLDDAAADRAVVPMPPDGDDMMGY